MSLAFPPEKGQGTFEPAPGKEGSFSAKVAKEKEVSPGRPPMPEKGPDGAPESPPGKALVIGLLGGVASGKSAVAGLFRERGALVLNADEMAREVLDLPGMVELVETRLGPGLVGADGKLDRKALADKVFRSKKARSILESLVHPRVLAGIRDRLSRLREGPGLVVLDVPLLLEAGLEEECDYLVFVESPETERERRALQRGWAPGERLRREKTQMSLETKRGKADYIVNNSGSLDETRKQVLDLLGSWRIRTLGR